MGEGAGAGEGECAGVCVGVGREGAVGEDSSGEPLDSKIEFDHWPARRQPLPGTASTSPPAHPCSLWLSESHPRSLSEACTRLHDGKMEDPERAPWEPVCPNAPVLQRSSAADGLHVGAAAQQSCNTPNGTFCFCGRSLLVRSVVRASQSQLAHGAPAVASMSAREIARTMCVRPRRRRQNNFCAVSPISRTS
ncbi:hypothetical protein P154DRAFT_573278 [Amniculicola lignicola CBS 123094]|uniref:Uncharacterized protein n=1 Tax=Amniculicola lignicola CBS 123094 TaxID=1392246 RepID=A0A6A5WN40_9PLEO|nr:hypothetical protein P154DRAFT_573278 [Amniculicola lignicola CBS 123094]